MVREVLFGVGLALLLPLRFGLDGVLYSMPVSDLLTFVLCAAVIRYTYRALAGAAPPAPLRAAPPSSRRGSGS